MIFQREELMVPPPTDPTPSPPSLKLALLLQPPQNPTPTPTPPNTPPHPLPNDPNITKKLSKSINFKGIKAPNEPWKSWVNSLLPIYQTLWKKLGIFHAIVSSTYSVKRDDDFIFYLSNFWSFHTNTFIFSWGECTLTLEDVMLLGGFSVLGQSVINVTDDCCGVDGLKSELVKCCLEIKRKNNYHVPFYEWMKFFKGKGGQLEHVALLVQWLSRYVFCVDQFDIDVNSFGFALSLSKGVRIALAPAVLACVYRDLTLLKRKIVGFSEGNESGKSKISVWSPMQLVQLWAWERFPRLSPNPKALAPGQPRVARWHDVYRLKVDWGNVGVETAAGKFLWRPYAVDLENWEFPRFYADEGVFVVLNEEVDEELLSFARCLRACELVGLDCVEQYLPHRVGMQFGMDQDIPDFVPRLNADLKLAWSSYDTPLDGLELYLPSRLRNGDVTVRYSELWRRISPVQDAESAVPEKTRKRKRERKSMKVKNPSTCVEFPAGASETCNVALSAKETLQSSHTVEVPFCSSGKCNEAPTTKETLQSSHTEDMCTVEDFCAY